MSSPLCSTRLLFVDAETVFGTVPLESGVPLDAAGDGHAQELKRLQDEYGDHLKMVFVVQDGTAAEAERFENFMAKRAALNDFFGEGQDIVSQIPVSRATNNMFANILKRYGVNASDAGYAMASDVIDPRVIDAGITAIFQPD